jgi:uncharacterized membrane protein YkoI
MSEEYKNNIEDKFSEEDLRLLEENKYLFPLLFKNQKEDYETFMEAIRIIRQEYNGPKIVSITISQTNTYKLKKVKIK